MHCHQSMHQKYNTQSSSNVTNENRAFVRSIDLRSATKRQPLNRLSPLLSPLYPPRNAGRIDANHIFSQQSTVGRISNRRPIDSSPGDCRGFIIFPSIFSSLKGIHPPLPSPPSSYSIAPCRAKGKYFMEFLVAGTL